MNRPFIPKIGLDYSVGKIDRDLRNWTPVRIIFDASQYWGSLKPLKNKTKSRIISLLSKGVNIDDVLRHRYAVDYGIHPVAIGKRGCDETRSSVTVYQTLVMICSLK